MFGVRGVIACGLLMSISCWASGSLITFDLTMEYSGATPPAGSQPPPWLRATFDDGGSVGSVTVTLAATNLSNEEFVSYWMFNLNPDLNPVNLQFAQLSKTGTFDNPTIGTGTDAFKAAGNHEFDIEFAFAKKSGERFGPTEAVQYTITGIPTLTADSFDFLDNQGMYPTAAHVQGIAPEGEESGWITTPEPTTVALLALGGLGLLARRRRRSRGASPRTVNADVLRQPGETSATVRRLHIHNRKPGITRSN